MLGRIFLPAIVAGIAAGLLITLVQLVTTTPLIRAAEVYEQSMASLPHVHGDGHVHHHSHDEAAPPILFTALANVIVGVGYAMLLVACLSLHGRLVDGRCGVLWGLAGFAVFVIAPAVGLPPETPGMIAPDLAARQAWWLFAAGAAALGLWLAVFGRFPLSVLAGIAAALVPHLIGAPQPAEFGGAVPPELAARFAVTSVAVGAAFWVVLGWLTGTLYGRLQSAEAFGEHGKRQPQELEE